MLMRIKGLKSHLFNLSNLSLPLGPIFVFFEVTELGQEDIQLRLDHTGNLLGRGGTLRCCRRSTIPCLGLGLCCLYLLSPESARSSAVPPCNRRRVGRCG